MANSSTARRFGEPSRAADIRVGLWMAGMCVLIFAMILVGGATRLTDSGLSITEWQPILGVLPPLSEADWQKAFDLYRQIPEYRLQNRGMSLQEFQFIYWWEWGHRLLGRLIGLAFALPLAAFILTRQIGWNRLPRLALILVLGGLQGGIGWWMVASGLTGDRLDVAAYRLATHLSLAFILFGACVWTAFDLLAGPARRVPARAASPARLWAWLLLALVAAQVVLGAFTAGTDAGFIHNDWPLMGGQWIPQAYDGPGSWLHDAAAHPAAIQFHHRLGAYILMAVAVVAWLHTRRDGAPGARGWMTAVLLLVWAQAGLGIATLMTFGAHPPPALPAVVIGIAHQGLGALVFAAALMLVRQTR